VVFSSQKGGILMNYGMEGVPRHPLLHSSSLNSLINLDRPYHTPLRMEHMTFFRADFVAELRKRVTVHVNELLDEMAKQGPVVDMVERFSAELPLFTLCEILGVPPADRPKLVHWMHFLETTQYQAEQEGLGNVTVEQITAFMNEIQAMFEYGRYLLNERRKNPQPDLLSAIANVQIDGKPLSPEFLDGSWLLIVFAGNDTTRNSLSGTMKLLTQNPDQKKKLQADDSLFPNFVHESIRMVSPVTYMRRTATTDTVLGNQPIGEGEKLVMYYASANRDATKFENPDMFDITRANAKEHLSFGHGPHVCLGQRVANMQLDAAYRQILSRFPDIKWTGEQTIAPNNFVHAISSLMVDLGKPA
jgi:cytochrome P450